MPVSSGIGLKAPIDSPRRNGNADTESRTNTESISSVETSSPAQKTLKYDSEYAAWRKPYGDKTRMPPCATLEEIREFNDTFMRAVWAQLPPQPSITRVKHIISSYDGAQIEVVRFATQAQMNNQTPLPAILYFHGGGMVAVSVEIFAPQIARLAANSGVQVFGVEYRLAPEFPAPTPVEDCYAALTWVSSHAAEMNLDPARLGLMGDSAGGGLAAGTALMARDRGLDPPVKKQILVYPMLDDRSTAALTGESPLDTFATIPLSNINMCWAAYLGTDKAGKDEADVSPYAAPGRADDLRGLPSTYIDVGGLDLFRDECAVFAARLAAMDVEVEFHLFPGVPHGFESASSSGITRRAYEGRLGWMRDR